MLEYLDKFKKLSLEIREKISSAAKTKIIEDLEAVYGVALASFVMRVVVGDIYFNNLAANIVKEFELDPKKSLELEADLNNKVFNDIADYLKKGSSKPILSLANSASVAQKVDLSHLFEKESRPVVTPMVAPERQPSIQKVKLSHLFPNKKKDEETLSTKEKIVPNEPELKSVIPVKEDETISAVKSILSGQEKQKKAIPVLSTASVTEAKNISVAELPSTTEKGNEETEIDDENEIETFSARASELKKNSVSGEDMEQITAEVAKEAGISFSSGELDNRFRQILATYLRGVRNRIDTRESLTKEAINGGVALDLASADKVLKILDAKNSQADDRQEKINIKAGQEGTAFIFNDDLMKKNSGTEGLVASKIDTRDIDYDLASVLKKNEHIDKEAEDVAEKEPVLPEEKLTEPEEKAESSDSQGQSFTKEAVLGEGEESGSEREIFEQNRPAPSTNRLRVNDIKPAPKTMSPIDELYYMNLTVFRRLGTMPSDRTAKIKEKIDLLSKQGIEKRFEAINAWRESPINKLYLNIGKQSLGEGGGVEEIIAKREAEGQDFLKKEEFEAVMDLNEELRF